MEVMELVRLTRKGKLRNEKVRRIVYVKEKLRDTVASKIPKWLRLLIAMN